MRIKNSLKLKPYFSLDKEWTKVANTMLRYIDDNAAFKVYVYLCYRYNMNYQYAFPSLETIAEECSMSKATVVKSIKYLENKKFIVRYKKQGKQWMNNCYYVRYVVETEEDKIKEQEMIIEKVEKMLGDSIEFNEEIEIFLDENGNIIKEEKIKKE